MTRDQIVELFARRNQAWLARDVGALARTHAENGALESPMFGDLSGREAIATSYASLFRTFPDWTLSSEELLIDGDRVAQFFVSTATHASDFMGLPASGRQFRIEGVRLYRMGDGVIQDERRIYDFTGLLIQVGVLKSKLAV
jgi:steroid delta-isomerase-like uncharacterized protein